MASSANVFMVVGALLMVGASGWSFVQGDVKLGIVYGCYAVANAVLSLVRG